MMSAQTVTRIIISKGTTATVITRSAGTSLRVVQSASPIPAPAGDVADPGDLTLVFDNKLI